MNDLSLDNSANDDGDKMDLDVGTADVDTQDAVEVNITEQTAPDADEPNVPEEQISDELEKKTETEIINEYLRPNSRCILCTTPIWSLKLNKAYLDGCSYNDMIDKFSMKFEERTGRSLNKSLLHRHFKSHFDARAAAIAEYNKRRGAVATVSSSIAQKDIFKLTTQKYLDELEMFDATAKEMIIKYQELETLIEEKKQNNKSFGIDELILKQAQILNSLNKQAISKFKALSRVDLESKQGQLLSQLGFIGSKALTGLSQVGQLLSPQETEEIYLNVVIKQMLARLEGPLKTVFGVQSKDQKALFYRELKKSIEGIQEGITADFDRQLKTKNQKLITDKQDSQH